MCLVGLWPDKYVQWHIHVTDNRSSSSSLTVVMAHTWKTAIRRAAITSAECVEILTHNNLDVTLVLQLLIKQGATSTLDYMQQFWLNADGTNEHLWNVRRECFCLSGDC